VKWRDARFVNRCRNQGGLTVHGGRRPGHTKELAGLRSAAFFASFRHWNAARVISCRVAIERARPANRSHSAASVRHSSKDFASFFMRTALNATEFIAKLTYSRVKSIENSPLCSVNNVIEGVIVGACPGAGS
jgi:hypothetical protein